MKIYIAGPMRGLPGYNLDAFDEMATWLRAKGYEVFNPADYWPRDEHGPLQHTQSGSRDAMSTELSWIAQNADAVYMLQGWEKSTGAMAEWALARALGLLIFYQAGIEDYEWKEVAHVVA